MVAIPNGRKRLPAVRLKALNVSNYNLAFLMRLLETPKELPRSGMDLLVAVPTASNISSSIDVNVKNRCSQSRNAKDFEDCCAGRQHPPKKLFNYLSHMSRRIVNFYDTKRLFSKTHTPFQVGGLFAEVVNVWSERGILSFYSTTP